MKTRKLELHFPDCGLDRGPARDRVADFYEKIDWKRDLGRLRCVTIEMVLNIFDHANGLGGVMIEADSERISFKVWDHGQGFDWDRCKALYYSTKKGNGLNFGCGVTVIVEAKKVLMIQAQISGKGVIYTYTGRYKYEET